jgi:hypothetical protein
MDNDPRTVNIINRSDLLPTFVTYLFEPRATGVRDDGAWKFVLVLLAAPVAVAGALSWLLATWAGSWLAPAAAALLLVAATILTVCAKRAKGGRFS